MKHLRFAIVVSACLALALAASGQEKKMEKKAPAKAPAMEMPKPGPEVKKLAYFVGNWTSEGDMKENPFGMPPGKFTGSDKCEWFQGGYQVVCHSTGKGPMGPMHSLGIIAYNANDKMYTYYGIDSMGMAEESKGNVSGDTWTYTADEKMGGKTYHGKYTIMVGSPDSYTFKYETSEDGQKWSTMMEGKSTKAGAAKKS
ncbi:MAG TPA: DUF1579 family protein [Thermoanaerobaculia bacterium]|nr:DUF1579 family protein [Thermoanaerobaculia bacterium]